VSDLDKIQLRADLANVIINFYRELVEVMANNPPPLGLPVIISFVEAKRRKFLASSNLAEQLYGMKMPSISDLIEKIEEEINKEGK
jgi:hypothetical protein